ncbi:GvpL/GvpF family gas vesicle protein [Streptomyces sp. NPDC048638]|uniref:GvpL/GvpF family gas vesicle protein n=1 Tax=Streptomyces sp. NPDC048638 TaxID=3365580 RepID=UPI00371C11A5
MNAQAPITEAADTPPDRPDTSEAPGATVSYAYAVSRAGTALDTTAPQLTGLEGRPLRTVVSGGLAALVSSVPAGMYSEEGMKAQLGNLSALEVIARTHHAVVDAAYARTTALPMRLATVYRDDARVRSMLRERGAAFVELLSWLEGHVELGVKIYADPREAATEAPSPASVSPGRAYLQRRRAQQRSQRDVYRAAGAVAADIPGRVAAVARARCAHRPQQGELASGAGENITNDAYLVPAERTTEFRQVLAGLADGVPGVRIEITGPWAPYSFATPPAAGGSA